MGKRSRRRGDFELPTAASTDYADADGNVLTLRGALTPRTRREYADVRAGLRDSPSAAREDSWHRAAEFLFEHLAVCWVVADLPIEKPNDLLARYRFASAHERDWIRGVLRSHLGENFPELESP